MHLPLPGNAPPSFLPEDAHKMAFLSLVAMCDDDKELQRWANETGFQAAHRFHYDLNRTAVLLKDNTIFVVFAGTAVRSRAQWKTHNLRIDTVSHSLGGRVHTGFYEALHSKNGQGNDLYEDVLKEVARLKSEHPAAHILFGGHSLGGAMCALAMADIAAAHQQGTPCPLQPDDIDAAYVLGAPRVGEQAFIDAFNASYKDRFHNGIFRNDPVPRAPIEQGTLIWDLAVAGMKAPGTLHYLDGTMDSAISFGQVPRLWRSPKYLPNSLHHLPQYYERAYGKLCGMDHPYEHVPAPERLLAGIKDYKELAQSLTRLSRQMPSFS